MLFNAVAALVCTTILAVSATPAYPENAIQARDAAVDNIVYVTDANKFWYVCNSIVSLLAVAKHVNQNSV